MYQSGHGCRVCCASVSSSSELIWNDSSVVLSLVVDMSVENAWVWFKILFVTECLASIRLRSGLKFALSARFSFRSAHIE
jgi:hypothetical protein